MIKTKYKKVILITIATICAIIVFITFGFMFRLFAVREKSSHDINEYNELLKVYTYLPSVDEMGEYSDLKFTHLNRYSFIFNADTYTVRVKYENEEFLRQKDFIQNNYSFQQTITNNGGINTTELSANFEMDSFNFRILSVDEYNLDHPSNLVFIGASASTNEIVYIVFNDSDLDYIEGTLQEFLEEECGWEE